mmetsp:Transcript_29721/g.69732  ORF Transcript_29721/g.69732 Transcript_29721/m.69732 type:complete len:207 (-) Transcript_29721:151-771(-)
MISMRLVLPLAVAPSPVLPPALSPPAPRRRSRMTICSLAVSFISYRSWPYLSRVLNQRRSLGEDPVWGWKTEMVASYTLRARVFLSSSPSSSPSPPCWTSSAETRSNVPLTPFSMALGLTTPSATQTSSSVYRSIALTESPVSKWSFMSCLRALKPHGPYFLGEEPPSPPPSPASCLAISACSVEMTPRKAISASAMELSFRPLAL